MKDFLWPDEVVSVTGVTYKQLQYWDRTGFLTPEVTGERRRYSYADVVAIHAILLWKQLCVSVQRLRKLMPEVLKLVRGLSTNDLATSRLLLADDGVIVVRGNTLMTHRVRSRYTDADLESLAARVQKLSDNAFID